MMVGPSLMLFSAPSEDVLEAEPLGGDGWHCLLPLDGGRDHCGHVLDLLVVILARPVDVLGG